MTLKAVLILFLQHKNVRIIKMLIFCLYLEPELEPEPVPFYRLRNTGVAVAPSFCLGNIYVLIQI